MKKLRIVQEEALKLKANFLFRLQYCLLALEGTASDGASQAAGKRLTQLNHVQSGDGKAAKHRVRIVISASCLRGDHSSSCLLSRCFGNGPPVIQT